MWEIFWIALGGILALNVVLIAGATISVALEKHRHNRTIGDLEALRRPGPRGHSRSALRRAASRADRRSRGRRLAGSVVVVVLVCAGTAAASPQARRVMASALGTVADGLGLGPSEQQTSATGSDQDYSAAPASGTSHTPEVTLGDNGSVSPGSAAVPGASGTPDSPSADPAGPTTLTAVAGSSTQIDLGWTDVANETGYRVERSSDGDTGWIPVAITGQDVTTYSNTGLSASTTYYYRVFATSVGGDSLPSDVVSATTGTDPASPTTMTATAGSSAQIDLDWTDVANETGYRVERSSDGDTGWIPIATTGQDVTTYSDSGLSSGTTYYYRVFATNVVGDSPPSDVVSATTIADPESPSTTDVPTP